MEEENKALIARMIDGDEAAFDEIYRSYSGKLYRMAYFITGNEEDLKLEEAGKLNISYGSSETERKSFKNVSWEKDGLKYLLFTFENKSLDDLINIAKAYIDEAQ